MFYLKGKLENKNIRVVRNQKSGEKYVNFTGIIEQKSEFFSNSDQNKILEFVKLTYDPV